MNVTIAFILEFIGIFFWISSLLNVDKTPTEYSSNDNLPGIVTFFDYAVGIGFLSFVPIFIFFIFLYQHLFMIYAYLINMALVALIPADMKLLKKFYLLNKRTDVLNRCL